MDQRGAYLDRLLDVRYRGQGLIADLDPLSRVFRCGLAGGQDDGHRFTHVANLVRGYRVLVGSFFVRDKRGCDRHGGLEIGTNILSGEDRHHPVGLAGAGGFDADDARVGLWAANDGHVGQARLRQVVDEAARARDQLGVFAALDRRADHLGDRHISSPPPRKPWRALSPLCRLRSPSLWTPSGSP